MRNARTVSVLLVAAVAFAGTPGWASAAPEVVSPGGKWSYLTGAYVDRVDPNDPNSVINCPIDGRIPLAEPVMPIS